MFQSKVKAKQVDHMKTQTNIKMLFLYTKTAKYIGKISENKGEIIFEPSHEDVAPHQTIIRDLLPKLRLQYIRGNLSGSQVIDYTVTLLPQDTHFWSLFAEKLAAQVQDIYVVSASHQILWSSIEEELGTFLGNGMLEDAERDAIVAKLPHLTQEEILLTHYLLKQMALGFSTLSKK